jgi:uncharacterized protein YycO
MDVTMLAPGDILLYSGKGVFSALIKWRTWSHISHAEIYVGNGTTWTSRDGKGSNFYPFSDAHLAVVMRPLPECQGDLVKGIAWAKQHCGKPYDFKGLMAFSVLRRKAYTEDKFFCSEAVIRFAREAGCELFNAEFRADDIYPGLLLTSPHLRTIWTRGD